MVGGDMGPRARIKVLRDAVDKLDIEKCPTAAGNEVET
ncbi:UNVERIFIED_ORG: hypothetical protein J2W87_001731 [Pseudomonas putida]|nr:hypothetical protein [Pseudomonas putida]